MYKGTCRWFSNSKGYGFITSPEIDDGKKDIFVHYTVIKKHDTDEGYRSISQGQEVWFNTEPTRKGNGLQASEVYKYDPLLFDTGRTSQIPSQEKMEGVRDGDSRPVIQSPEDV